MINTYSIKDEILFQKLINKGTWYGANFICMYIIPNKTSHNYIGLGVGKKAGKAYVRNRIKRLIKACYTNLEPNISFGYNMLFVWKSKADFDKLTYSEMYNDMRYLLTKAGVLK